MNALWIIDLTESENAIKAFYDSFWNAYLDNLKDPTFTEEKRNPWFCISTPNDLGLKVSDETPAQEISNMVYAAVRKADHLINPVDGMIKYPFHPSVNKLMIVIMGDIAAQSTRRYFLPLTTSLRVDTRQPNGFNPTPNVYFYGMLFRREEVATGVNLKSEEKAFLNQMHNMQNTWQTFDHVMFFEKPKEKKKEAVSTMALASLHLACEDANATRVLYNYSQRENIPTYLNAGSSGIFFEREVQNDREAFLLGHTLLEPFVNSTEREFYDKDSAVARAKNISTFRNNELDETKIYHRLASKMPILDTSQFDIPMPVNPGSPKVKEVWECYYGKDGYIANLKANLVNKVQYELSKYETNCLDKLSENQLAWIKEQSAAVEDGIFGVFDDEHPDVHCSMHQAIEVAKQAENLSSEKLKDKAENISLRDEEGFPIRPIPIPKRYEKAIATAKLGDGKATEKSILDELDTKLRRHPVFMHSMFSRALLLSIIIGAFFLFYQPVVAAILFLIPFVAYFIAYRHYMNMLKSLQDRYVGVRLDSLNDKLLKKYKEAIHKSQNDIKKYCKWNWDERLAMLRNNLGVFVPKEFHFKPFEDFQPLLTDSLEIDTEEKNKQAKKVGIKGGEKRSKPAMSSGMFDKINILSAVPNFNVKADVLEQTQPKSVTELTNTEKMRLIHKLMGQSAFVPEQMEENLDPAKMVMKTGGSIVLMLDVSGSMCGQPHEDLKQAVKTLKDEYHEKVRWVAFADRAIMDSDPMIGGDLDKAEMFCGGGTAYVPAFELLMEGRDKNLIDLGKLIIISDGCPFDTEEARKKILDLGCVVDVIYIGGGDENYLRELAESTGGTLQQVQDVKNAQIETVVEEGIKTGFKLADEGDFAFGDLLRKSAIKPSMKALLIFTKNAMQTNDISIESIIADNGDETGLNNWLENHAKMSAVNGGAVVPPMDIFIKSSGIDQQRMCNKLQNADANFTGQYVSTYKLFTPPGNPNDPAYVPPKPTPDILVTQLHLQPLDGIKDLGWAYDPYQDTQINNEERFDELFRAYFNFDNHHQFVNIYNQPIA